MLQRAAALGLALLMAPSLAFAQGTSHASAYLPGCTNSLVSALGDCVTLGSGVTYSDTSKTLTASGGTGGGSAVRVGQWETSTPGSNPLTTTPYYLTTYAELPGTINAAVAAGLSSSGANLYFVVHIVHAGTDTPVGGLNNVPVCDGESGCPSNQTATYAAPLTVAATSANTYAVGDQVYVSYNTVGGTFTNFTLHIRKTE